MVWCFFPWSRMICWLVECSQTEVFSKILWKLILQILRFWKNSEKSRVDNMTCFSHRRPWLRFQRFHGGVGLGIQGQSHWMVSLYMREIGRGTLQTWLMIDNCCYYCYYILFLISSQLAQKKWSLRLSTWSFPWPRPRPQVSHPSRRAKLRKQRRSEAEA